MTIKFALGQQVETPQGIGRIVEATADSSPTGGKNVTYTVRFPMVERRFKQGEIRAAALTEETP